jgi:XRE family aerobic/anaerobic benzoate catabolism transcriptional regulator
MPTATFEPDGARQAPAILHTLARRVLQLRRQRGWTRARLARASGLSVRFLARIESGEGNVSLARLDRLAVALGSSVSELVRQETNAHRLVVLVGLRGAGKSTVGPLVAARLGVAFVEMDRLIGEASGLTLDQLFEIHGEEYYRRLERATLRRIVERGEPAVVAAAGGVVNEPETWLLLRERATTVWLRARPEEHWSRVIAQGDRRPMADNPGAMQELRSLLAAREPVYAQAHCTVETSGRSPDAVAEAIEEEVRRVRGD